MTDQEMEEMDEYQQWYEDVAELYERLIAKENDPRRKEILISLADGHAEDNK